MDNVYLSRDPSADPKDILLGQVVHSGALSIAPLLADYTGKLNATLPIDAQGAYYLLVFADAPPFLDRPNDGAVKEFRDEGNNITSLPITVTPQNTPDLQLSVVTTDAQAVVGQSFQVSYTVKNFGAGTPSGQARWAGAPHCEQRSGGAIE
jgi:hypothetical protein